MQIRWLRASAVALFVAAPGCYCSHDPRPDVPADVPADVPSLDAPPLDVAIADTPFDSPDAPFDAGPACMLAGPNAELRGTTPLGPIDFRFGYAGRGNTSKACFGLALYWTDSGTLGREMPARQAWVWLPRPSVEPIVGTHRGVTITVMDGAGMESVATAEVEVTAYTRDEVDPAARATIRVIAPGWDLTGHISAPHCIVFADPCI